MKRSLRRGRIIGFILSALMSLCVLTTGSTSARYVYTASSYDSAKAARFSVVTTLAENKVVLDDGDEKSVFFTVSNGNGDTVSEVSLIYDVIVSYSLQLEVACGFKAELYRNGEQITNVGFERTFEIVDCTFFDVGNFEAGIKAVDECELRISVSSAILSETFKLSVDVLARQDFQLEAR